MSSTSDVRSASRSLLGRGSVYSIVNAIQALAGLLVLPAITRILGADSYGVVALALLLSQVLTIFACFGLPMSVTRQYFIGSGGAGEARSLVRQGSLLALALMMVFLITVPMWAGVIATSSTRELVIVACTVWPGASLLLAQSLLRAANRVGEFVVVGLLGSVGGQFIGLSLLLFVSREPSLYLIGILAGQSVAAIWAFLAARPSVGSQGGRGALAFALRLGLPTIPHSVALFALGMTSRFLVERQLGISMAGRFQVAYVLGMLPVTFLGAINNAWAPMVLGRDSDSRWQLLADTTKLVHVIAAITTTTLTLLAPLAILIVAPSSYNRHGLALLASIISLSALGNTLYLSRVHVVFVRGRTRILMFLTPGSLLVAVTLGMVMVNGAGLVGAAVITPLAFLLQGLGLAYFTRGLARVPWSFGNSKVWLVSAPFILFGVLAPSGGVWLLARLLITVVFIGASAMLLVRRFQSSELAVNPN